jgi:hypothetical protein
MFGCFTAGWFGDKYGRKKGVWLGSIFGVLGGSLMSASQNSNMFICARVIAGFGIGFINTIVPPWISELARAHNRGVNFALIFTANCESSFHLVFLVADRSRYRYHHCLLDQLWRSKQLRRILQMEIPVRHPPQFSQHHC